jgi:hypothetical protein
LAKNKGWVEENEVDIGLSLRNDEEIFVFE